MRGLLLSVDKNKFTSPWRDKNMKKILLMAMFFSCLCFFSIANSAKAEKMDSKMIAGITNPETSTLDSAGNQVVTTQEKVIADSKTSGSVVFENPISSSSVSGLLAQVLSALRSLIIVLATVFIVIGGIMYMISAGNSGMAERAKKIITASLIGLVIALSANTFIIEIWNILKPTDMSKPAGLGLVAIATNVLSLLVSLVWVLGVIGMVIGGGFMLTAYGNEERAKKGKTVFTYSILGVVISLSALIIVGQIQQLIGG